MNSTHHTGGRFGNHLFRNMAVHFIAKNNKLKIDYTYAKEMNDMGILLYQNDDKESTSYSECLSIGDHNFFDLLKSDFHGNISILPNTYCQTPEFAQFLYNHFYSCDSDAQTIVIDSNIFKERYNNNTDVFIHVRLGDISHFSPGFQYYDEVLSKLEFSKGFISSDSIGDVICTELIEKYHLEVIEMTEVNTIMFGSTCKHIILSQGTFSWWIGLLGFHSNVYYPKINENMRWHGDIFVFPSWNKVDFQNLFDIVIPLGPSDIDVITEQLKYTKKNVKGYRNIYIISYDDSLQYDGCITVSETIFPFNKDTIRENTAIDEDRVGWYLQQLLKLYCGFHINGLLDKYLIIDSDTFFLKPTTFVENSKCLYNYATEMEQSYFDHMARLDRRLTRKYMDKSGICHHMMFEISKLRELFNLVETNHDQLFYKVFISQVTYSFIGASEYELYFNFLMHFHEDRITLRKLSFVNSPEIIPIHSCTDIDYFSYHFYMRQK